MASRSTRPESNNSEEKTVYVLSLDGGGIKGLYMAILLDKIAQLMNKPIQSMFDLIVGTSIGGMFALNYAQADEKTLVRCESLFTQRNIDRIFDKSIMDRTLGLFQWKPKYDGQGKTSVINESLRDIGINECKTNVAITSFKIGNFNPQIFCSWHDSDNIRTIADITSAAPLYFPPIRYNSEWYVDGGVGVNNPNVLSIVYAKELYPGCRIKLLSIGSGSWFPKFKDENMRSWGLVEWVKHGLIDMTMSSSSIVNDLSCKLLLENDFLRLNNKQLIDISMDDTNTNSLEKMRQLANETFTQNRDTIYELLR